MLANSNKAGIQSACWDLRVQPNPAPPPAPGARGATPSTGSGQAASTEQGRGTASAAPAAGGAPSQEQSPFGAGCPAPVGQGGGGGFGGGGVNVAGPFVIGGVYNVSLVVDGKTVDTKPLRVNDDPDVVLTSVERKRMFDMAMEIHALQPRITDASTAHASLTRQMAELTTSIGDRSDIPADVKAVVRGVQQGTGGARAEADHAAGPRRRRWTRRGDREPAGEGRPGEERD